MFGEVPVDATDREPEIALHFNPVVSHARIIADRSANGSDGVRFRCGPVARMRRRQMELFGQIDPDRPLLVVALTEEAAQLFDLDLPLLVTGAGKVNAASATASQLAGQRPREVVNLGTAGALVDGLEGIHEVGSVIQHDFDNEALEQLVGRSFSEPIAIGEGVVLATGDAFISDSAARERLAMHAQLVDMEGYGVAHAARQAGVPARIVKIVSDSGDEQAGTSLVDALARCAEQLADWVNDRYA